MSHDLCCMSPDWCGMSPDWCVCACVCVKVAVYETTLLPVALLPHVQYDVDVMMCCCMSPRSKQPTAYCYWCGLKKVYYQRNTRQKYKIQKQINRM